MAEIKLPGHIDAKVDFDDFWFKQRSDNRDIAKEIAGILLASTSIDELRGLDDQGQQFSTTVGTGTSMDWPVSSQSHQRALLAHHFICYAKRHYSSCCLTVHEYHCLRNLRDELKDDFVAEHRQSILDKDLALINEVCQQFAKEYSNQDPSFLLEVIKEAE